MADEILKVALVQTDLHWQDKIANLAMLEEKLWQLPSSVDLIVLPEMFATGFSMDVNSLSEPMNHTICKWMVQLAKQLNTTITGSAIIQDSGKFYNRMLWVCPDGAMQWYDKRHLFRMAEEDQSYTMGSERKIFEVKGWKILPQVCYDLRFPVWSRNNALKDGGMEYDLSIYVASWPAARVKAWDILLQARSVENLCYTIGVNRIGTDGNGIEYSGHSAIFDFKGECMSSAEENEEILILKLRYSDLTTFREKFPAWKDADKFELKF
ncbi:amidohydrolase [Belliella kenyensis]|uniref:Amidohydrolase n=2 Tax=Belliella kenyensis TaxID=1472724 RepID=A0ABV8EH46_9BACT|nr:amidohydrolase [Belliella kenyensis]MCH7403151.1 amidohydrolase [Belliella kenyensis]MDN3602320.1 amidohydrolase [Belliella kenyensis]